MGHAEPSSTPEKPAAPFQPFVPPHEEPREFSLIAVVFGSIFGIVFGASTVYLALRAGLTVSASIPIAVIAISVLRVFRSTILENNIVQTIGSAGESVAAGVAFTVPALLFLSPESRGPDYFSYGTIMMLAACGGILGVLFMVPLRRALIVKEHGNLPYPEGTACADVLIAGQKGGRMAAWVFGGVGLAVLYQVGNVIFRFWEESVAFITTKAHGLANMRVAHTVSPEYLGVGYILGIRTGGIMVSGSVLTFCVLIPLIAFMLGDVELGRRMGMAPEQLTPGGIVNFVRGNYTRYIGAGAVTMAGIITLLRTMPTIVRSLRESAGALRGGGGVGAVARTERDLPLGWVVLGSVVLVGVIAVLPILPDTGSFTTKLIMAALMLAFGFLFVTVSSRIVGIIGSSSNPISGMTIATLLGTCLVFLQLGLGGQTNEAIALSVGAVVCIAAANAGATSQDLKTGFLVGATPIRQQIGLVIGVLVSTAVIGITIKLIDQVYADPANGVLHGIGTDRFPAPQATLMATVIQGVMSQSLPWEYILIGAGLALMIWLAGASPLAWAVGVYLPIETTLPIFVGGALRAIADNVRGDKGESEIAPGMLFATGLVAGGTLTGVASAALAAIETQVPGYAPPGTSLWNVLRITQHVGEQFQQQLGVNPHVWALIPYGVMALLLFIVATRKVKTPA
jgi:putative OPT family oligopeptide transporter